jgi:hypothetical protein
MFNIIEFKGKSFRQWKYHTQKLKTL